MTDRITEKGGRFTPGKLGKAAPYAAGTAALAAGMPAYGVTVLGPVSNVDYQAPPLIFVDIDGDGNNDLRLQATYDNPLYASIFHLNDSQAVASAGTYTGNGVTIRQFLFYSGGETVNSTSLNGTSGIHFSRNGTLGAGTHYIAGSIRISGSDHLYWAEFNITNPATYANAGENVLVRAAYNTVPIGTTGGNSIVVGSAIPEPGSASLLAMGAAGVAALRRRRRKAAE